MSKRMAQTEKLWQELEASPGADCVFMAWRLVFPTVAYLELPSYYQWTTVLSGIS